MILLIEIVLKDGEDANQPNRENNNKLNLNDIVSVSDLKKDESDLGKKYYSKIIYISFFLSSSIVTTIK